MRAEVRPQPGPDRAARDAVEITVACLVHAGIACMTCRDVCPELAISMRPRMGGPFLPELDEAACTGCGECVAHCPADAIAAPRPDRHHG